MGGEPPPRAGQEEMSEGPCRVGGMTTLHVDCDGCAARGPGCADCVISVLLGPPGDVEFDDSEVEAMAVLADAGLVPPLRLVSTRRDRPLGDSLKVV